MEYFVTASGIAVFIIFIFIINKFLKNSSENRHFPDQSDMAGIEQRNDFEGLKSESKFQNLLLHINAEQRTTFDVPGDEETFKIVYAVKMSFSGVILKYNDPAARYLIVYLEGAKRKLQYTYDLKEDHIKMTKLPDIVYNAAVPPIFRNYLR